MELQKEIGNMYDLIEIMHNAISADDSDNDAYKGKALYDCEIKVGFEDFVVSLPMCASHYNAFVAGLKNLICSVIEEEDLEFSEPYKSLYDNYYKEYRRG